MKTAEKHPQGPLPEPQTPARGLPGAYLLVAVALLVIGVLSWTESDRHVQQKITQELATAREQSTHDAHDIALGLRRNLSLLHGIPATFTRSQQVAEVLQTGPARTGTTLNRFLERSVADLNAVSVLWVIDRQGNCIASSNASTADSFVGTNYSDRDYFQVALQGFSGRQFATGKKTGIPGMYFSAPVMQNEKILGVVVAKVDLPFLALWLSQANAFVTDKYGVVILATDSRLTMHAFGGAAQHPLSEAQSWERYRIPRVPALGMQQLKHADFTDLIRVNALPNPMLHTEQAVADDGLVVHVLVPIPSIVSMDQDRITRFALESGFGLLVLLLVSTAVYYVRNIQRARAALLVHKSRLDEAQLLAQVGSWELDLHTGAMRWSDQVQHIFRTDPTASGPSLATFMERIQDTDRPRLLNILEDVSGALQRVECSVGIVRTDGDVGRARLQLQPVKAKNGMVEGYLGTLRDTTEQDQLESDLRRAKVEAESASRLKSDFLANISHELKTPMNAILGMSHLALQGDLSPPQKTHIQTVYRSAEHLLHIINEILDYSSIEAGRYSVEKREFLLRDVTRKLVDAIARDADEKGLEFQLDIAPALPVRLRGDPIQLEKILQALASNAVKFTQEGRVSVGVEIAAQTGSHMELHFWVNDTGVGMTTEQQAHLFKVFSQADSSRTRKFGGTGLGLAIAKRLVDMLGGRLWVQSTFGTGTTCHFTIPFEKVAEAPSTSPFLATGVPDTGNGLSESLAGMHVLLVEDNPVNQELARLVLKKFHITTTVVTHGQEALDLLATRADFQAILMDCHMPVMDGYTAAREIRKIEAFNAIPIIALTANVSSQDRKKIFESGMCDVVAKPYRAQELLDVLLRWTRPAHGTPTETELTVLPPSTDDPLPSLPGIDVAYGLAIAMSDAHLYKKLLQLFAQSEAEFAGKFHSAWQAGDGELAARLAHSLKGVAASIGAKDVQATALALETACHQGLTDAAIRPALEQTLAALQLVLHGLVALQEPNAAGNPTVADLAGLRVLVQRLTALLAQHDLSAFDVAEALGVAVAGSPLAPLVKKVIKAIDRFDLDAAQDALKTIAVTLEEL